MEHRKIDNTSQEAMEAYMEQTVRENHVDQAGRINAMIRPEYVSCSFDEKKAVLRYPAQDWQANRMSVVHGGIITTCMDNAMAILNMFLAGEYFTPTLTMEMKFLRPMPLGADMLITVEAIAAGKNIAHMRSEVINEATGKPVAVGTATFMTTGLAVRS